MATPKASKQGASKKKAGGDRCWKGYEPAPGKKPGTQGSCKPKDE